MISIPHHVVQPSDPAQFIPEEQCRALKSAGLGYSILKALGGSEQLSSASVKVIQDWCKKHCDQFPDVVPDERRLKKASFADRLFRPGKNAMENAARFPGAPGKPSYHKLFHMVWVEQQWPELCRALSDKV